MKRYSAKLLFQYRVGRVRPGERCLCEERIILLAAPSPKQALTLAKRKGRAGQHKYRNPFGEMVHIEFVGIMDLLHLGLECEEGEVWYEFSNRLCPMERKDKLIPPDSKVLSRLSYVGRELRK